MFRVPCPGLPSLTPCGGLHTRLVLGPWVILRSLAVWTLPFPYTVYPFDS